MSVTVNFYDINYNNTISTSSQVMPIPMQDKNMRLPSEVRDTLENYPSLRFLADFTANCWKYSSLFPSATRVLIARLFKNFSKLMSGLEYELPDNASVIQEIYLSQIKISCIMIEEWMIKHQTEATKSSTVDGGIVVELTPTGYALLEEISSWSLFENVYSTGAYSSPFIIDHKFQKLLMNIAFKF